MPQESLDSDLIARAIQRDPEAFGELYVATYGRVFRHIYYLIGDRHEAADLTNESFLRSWKVIDKYEDRGLPIENWLLKIGHNLAVRHLKQRRPASNIENVTLEVEEDTLPEAMAESATEADILREAILQLPQPHRQVIVWRFIENMSYDEVQEMLGKSYGAVRVLQYRALLRLREILERSESAREALRRSGPSLRASRGTKRSTER
jgi:RNA polymerase sigma-70 factor, ECF subfamily